MKLSVIVPVYNVEKFLPRCLDSLLRQGMEAGEYEVICVNDGSPDNSGVILAEYEKKHPDVFRVITQENQGQGAARNTGIYIAQGEYLSFIDSDDYVIDGAFRYLYDHFCSQPDPSQRPDVLYFQYRPLFTDGTTLADPEAKPDGDITFDGDGVEAYNRRGLNFECVWNKFYRHEFLKENNLAFKVMTFEDMIFNFEVFQHHPHLVIVSSCVNRYEHCNADSTMQTLNKARMSAQFNDLYHCISFMHNYLGTEKNPDLAPAAWRNLRIFHLVFATRMCRADFTQNEWQRSTKPLSLSDISLLIPQEEPTLLGRVILWLKKNSLRSYVIYRFTYWLNKHWLDKPIRNHVIGR